MRDELFMVSETRDIRDAPSTARPNLRFHQAMLPDALIRFSLQTNELIVSCRVQNFQNVSALIQLCPIY